MAVRPQGIPSDAPRNLPNCGVISVAMICGISYADAWDTIKKLTNANGNWKGRTFDHERRRMFDLMQVTYEILPGVRGMTLGAFLKSNQYIRSGTYEVTVTGHAMTLHRHRLFCQGQAEGVPAWESRMLKKRVRAVLQITGGSPLLNSGDESWHSPSS